MTTNPFLATQKRSLFREYINEALTSLLSSKQRTILALIGIVIGIASVIAMVSIGTIVEAQALSQFEAMGTNILKVSVQGSGGQSNHYIHLEDAQNMPRVCSKIIKVAPYGTSFGTSIYNEKSLDSQILAATHHFYTLCRLELLKGRFISELDKNAYFCVIGNELYHKISKTYKRNIIGSTILYKNLIFTVIGILKKSDESPMRPYGINDGLIIPLTTARLLPESIRVSEILVRIPQAADRAQAQKQIKDYFHRVNKDLNLEISSPEEIIKTMGKQMRLFTLLLGAIGSISLVVGGIGVMNVMLVSVSERKKEIGIRRAIGAQQSDIQWQFLIESIILSLIGGVIGMFTGVGVSYLVAHFAHWKFLICVQAIFLGVSVSALVGIFFGFFPARQAAGLNPIDALREE
ncbi:MAG: ABC transporter permease [Chlamydiota bacterium]|nr:ABC transporter permease [Chlamydiota bacterium]